MKFLYNGDRKSAYDLFFENRKEMIKNPKTQLVTMELNGSGLATGMIFALASFSFPNAKDTVIQNQVAFKIYIHAY